MRFLFKTCLILSSIGMITSHLQSGLFSEDPKKSQMIQDLEIIKHHFDVAYAPKNWKKEHFGVDLNKEFEKAKSQILSMPSITTKQFQQIVRKFVNSMRDYHVSVRFFSTEESSLPFSVKGSGKRCFVDWIDSLRLPPSVYNISIGDELVEFDGRPIADVIDDLMKTNGKSGNAKTDRSLADLQLTHRMGMKGDVVPSGPVMVKFKSKNGYINSYQLHWSYIPEAVKNPLDFLVSLDFISNLLPKPAKTKISSPLFHRFLEAGKKVKLPELKMLNPLHEIMAKRNSSRDGALGADKSFLPLLGDVIWMKEEDTFENSEDFREINWHAYIYRHPSGKKIGYVRIPHYLAGFFDAEEFGLIIEEMEEGTDALIIDQLHNPGGSVEFQYSLASMLVTKDPFYTPQHHIKITQKDVLDAYYALEAISFLERMIDEQGSLATSDSSDGFEEELIIDFQWLMFFKSYFLFIMNEWDDGHSLTRPTPICGVDRINPHPKFKYTKPILMLINELDFSGGDFVPAILQDNKRATLFGEKTAGAGGFVLEFDFPNSHGIAACSYTASIAERLDSKKIENLGVTPDIKYDLSVEDIRDGYKNYVQSINNAILDLIKSNK